MMADTVEFPLKPYTPPRFDEGLAGWQEWHADVTITLAELIECGFFNPDDDYWQWDYYSEEQYGRVCSKFIARYSYMEIGIIPPAQWHDVYIRKMNEIMPKYKLIYQLIDDGKLYSILGDYDRYYKGRDVFSDFPATQLNTENQDYGSNADDKQWEEIQLGDVLDKLGRFVKDYNDVDVCILDDCEILFSSLMVPAVNGY